MSEELDPTTQRNLDSAIAYFQAVTKVWNQLKLYGECNVRLKFVDGVALQWEAVQLEVHKTGQDNSVMPREDLLPESKTWRAASPP